MAKQRTTSQSLKSIAGAAVVGLGLVILFGRLDGPATQLTNLVGTAARGTLELLPYFVPAAWQDKTAGHIHAVLKADTLLQKNIRQAEADAAIEQLLGWKHWTMDRIALQMERTPTVSGPRYSF